MNSIYTAFKYIIHIRVKDQLIDEYIISHNKVISLVKGDITERRVDAIVNAANSYLKHGGGVAGSIVRKGGKIIQIESDKIGYVSVGSSVITTSGNLPCSAVIHTVGPRMGEGNEEHKLTKAIHNVLLIASEKEFKTISIPAISSGIFGFPKKRCSDILLNESVNFLLKNKTTLQNVEFCIIDNETLMHFKDTMKKIKNNCKKI
ncbi:MAG: macro domain-containing protein [Nitrososphaeraceae archaeon]